MKLLLENWREFIKQEVEEFLPHGEVRAVEMIGSSALSPEERAKQDLEKYGFVQDDDERDIDIEVQIAGITREEAEEWAFSDEADELEFNYNYDVQLRIVENWRKFVSEDVDPKMKKYLKKHPYMEPDQLQEEAAGQCFPFAVEMANAVPDNEFDDMSKFKVVHGRITDKFSGETTLHAWVEKGDVVFDWQTSATKPKGISKVSYYDIYQPEVHAEYTAEELLINCMKQGHKGPFNEESEFQTKMKKNLPAELEFLLNKGPHNKKEGPGVKNPPKPKFKSAPPGAPGGKRNDD